ncbi:MarR family transcriptional regulator [Actinoplanes sp. NBRC 103695]|uniref:MarR family winged helix-turn-helix transcriptional regulator n=1 Tax=Actinoplanes sp. NBRC 103695 TaxID=3032202 RepID=UPI0024A426B2|nr:MarR family transcriptional regulator [Actinoplanes sp. NBRC 103695]GLY95132.1 MarR family transcriptional regulator [Actinoplanes sp. NBRC 103695]
MAETTGLERMLCFELYTASRAITGAYRPALDELGLTYPQFVALTVIWQRGSITVRDLGHALHLDSGTLSPLLKRLETAGLVRRTRGTHDERTVVIEATDAGNALRTRAAELPERLACALGELGITHTEAIQLHHLLSRISTSARTITI